MTVGNVTDYIQMAQQVMAATQVAYGMITPQTSNTQDFSTVMNQAGQNTTDARTTNVEKDMLSTKHNEAYQNKSTIKDKLLNKDSKNAIDEKVNQLATEIRNTVKEALSLDDEQLEEMMAELGLTTADLLNPTNVVMLFATANEVAPSDIVMDGNLSDALNGLLEKIDALAENFAADNQIPMEDIADLISKTVTTQPDSMDTAEEATRMTDTTASEELAPKQEEVVVVKDEKTGKEVTLTVENNVTTSEEVTTQGTQSQPAADQKNSSEQERNTEHQNNSMNQVMQNLTEQISEALQNGEEVTSYSPVNATDVIQQMMDAIKVNATQSIQSMEIQLTPENLGKINLTVMAKDGVITASITAQNEAVKSALENQLVALKENLSNAGLKVENVEVTVASHDFESNLMNQNGQNEHNDNARQGAKRRFVEVEDDELEANVETLMDDSNINVTA